MPTFAENFQRFMKFIRTILTSVVAALCSLTALADDYQYLTVSSDGGQNSYTVSNIQKITFDATNMVLHLSDGTTQQLPLAGLQKMFFSSEGSGIAVGTMQSKMQFNGGMLRAEMADGERLTVYNMKGVEVFSANESGTYDLTTLTRGVYIVKVGNATKKVVNK
jgi:hypothetical protein